MSAPGIAGLIETLKALKQDGGIAHITGMTGGASALACARLSESTGGQLLIIVSSHEKAKQMEEFWRFLRQEGRSMFCLMRNGVCFLMRQRAEF